LQTYLDQWIEKIIATLPNLITAIVIFLVSFYLANLFSKLLRKVLQRRRAAPGVTNLLVQMIRWTVIVMGVITALQRFFDVTAFLAGLGILGFTIGFALQDVMKKFAAGVIMFLQEPFKVGEAVGVAGFDGTVLNIDLRTTEMKTLDGRLVIIPNADILSNAIVNYSRADHRRVELTVSISCDADPNLARKIVLDAIQAVEGFTSEPLPMVYFHTLAGSSMDLTAYFWIDTTRISMPQAEDTALTLIKSGFKQQGIEIPFPTRTVYLHSNN